MHANSPRSYAIAFLLAILVMLFLLCRLLAVRSHRRVAICAAGGYLAWLHLIFLYGLLTSPLFGNALPQLTLFTFPCSMIVGDVHMNEGFATLADLAANYARYIVLFGGLNALLVWGFVSLVVPRQAATQAR